IGAGGIGVLAYVSARITGRRLSRREVGGVIVSVLGLLALGVSLAGGSGEGRSGSTAAILLWLGASGVLGTPRTAAGASASGSCCRRCYCRRALLLDRRHLDESCDAGRRPDRLPPPARCRLHARDRPAASWLPGGRRTHRRGARDALDERVADSGRTDPARRAGSVRCVRRPAGARLRRRDGRRLPARAPPEEEPATR